MQVLHWGREASNVRSDSSSCSQVWCIVVALGLLCFALNVGWHKTSRFCKMLCFQWMQMVALQGWTHTLLGLKDHWKASLASYLSQPSGMCTVKLWELCLAIPQVLCKSSGAAKKPLAWALSKRTVSMYAWWEKDLHGDHTSATLYSLAYIWILACHVGGTSSNNLLSSKVFVSGNHLSFDFLSTFWIMEACVATICMWCWLIHPASFGFLMRMKAVFMHCLKQICLWQVICGNGAGPGPHRLGQFLHPKLNWMVSLKGQNLVYDTPLEYERYFDPCKFGQNTAGLQDSHWTRLYPCFPYSTIGHYCRILVSKTSAFGPQLRGIDSFLESAGVLLTSTLQTLSWSVPR